ncbi:MAG: YfjI family protein [Phycisphaerae bacterium]|nr:YfjI family protein [Phycisphaerae bacterium]
MNGAGESNNAGAESFRQFPLEALPERMRRFVEAVSAATGTDPAFGALAALVVAAGCIGNRVAALVKGGWIEPAVLWGLLLGRSGATKSPVLKLVTRAIVELYKDARREFAEATTAYEREVERYKIRLDEWKREQRKGPPSDPPEPPAAPIEKRALVSDVTVEKLGELLKSNPLGLLLVRDELTAWLGSFDRYAAGGKGSDQPAWLSFFDAATVVIDRKAGGTYFIERGAVSVLGSSQPGTVARVFGLAERESGLLARIIIAYPPDRPGLWTDEALPDAVADDWKRLVQSLFAIPPTVDDNGELRPRFIPIGRDAKPLWIEWHDRHAREIVDIADDTLAAHFSKLKGMCIRLALVFTCVEVASGGAAISAIGADAMRRAISVVEWLKHESRRVYAMLAESDGDRADRRLVEWLAKRGGVASVRDLTHGLREYRGDPVGAERALGRLVEAGRAAWESVAASATGGRPPRRIRLIEQPPVTKTPANPESFEGFGDGDTGDTSKTEPDGGEGFVEIVI